MAHREDSTVPQTPSQRQGSQEFVGAPASSQSLQNNPVLTQQLQPVALLPAQEDTPTRLSKHKPTRRRQKRTLRVIHPAVLPIESTVDQEVFELIDRTHFERLSNGTPSTRATPGRNAGYYKTGSDESTDGDSDDSDEWAPSNL